MINEIVKRTISALILLPLSFFLVFKGSYIFFFSLLILVMISMYEWNKIAKKKYHKFLGLFFILFSFYTFFDLRNDANNGTILVFFVLIICISTDIGGYVFGNIFKGPKLTKISPNKTYSGLIGSYVFSLLTIIVLLLTSFTNFFAGDYLNLFFCTILISTISQIGDIIISYFKRLSKIKDTGYLIPGHGGLLDRIDGMLFAVPFFYALNTLDILVLIS